MPGRFAGSVYCFEISTIREAATRWIQNTFWNNSVQFCYKILFKTNFNKNFMNFVFKVIVMNVARRNIHEKHHKKVLESSFLATAWKLKQSELNPMIHIITTKTHLTSCFISPENRQNWTLHDNAICKNFLFLFTCNCAEHHRRYRGGKNEKSNEVHDCKCGAKNLSRPKIQINWIRSQMKCKWDGRWKCSRERAQGGQVADWFRSICVIDTDERP